jgi:Concanavalin A-like lectin/glucanases superfamily
LETRSPDGASWCLDTFLRGEKDECTLRDVTKLHPAGRWTWVALVFDGRTMTDYVNGEKELEAEISFEPMTSGRTSLGVRLDRQYWFKGFMREIRFYPMSLAPGALQREITSSQHY